MVMEKSRVIELLKNEVIDIEFVKKDGTIRAMTCTLKQDRLPKQVDLEQHIQEKEKVVNEEFLAVFDTINQGWRSFRWNSLKNVNGQEFAS
jgi:hypothetical protein